MKKVLLKSNTIEKKEEIIRLFVGENGLNKYKKLVFSIEKKYNSEYQLVNKNIQFKNKYLDKRCFILGNGPSLKNVDFSKLTNEFVFTVNNAIRMDNFKDLNSNFHIWTDKAFWGENWGKASYEWKTLKENYDKLYRNKIKVFFPTDAYLAIKKYGYATDKKTFYFNSGLEINESMNEKIDLTNRIYGARTVVQYAIQMAIYMGFKEIYLLGCDNTYCLNYMQLAYDGQERELHVYDSSEDIERKYMQVKRNTILLESLVEEEFLVHKAYRGFNKYCQQNNIKIVNLSQPTLIDALEQSTLKKIL